MRSIDAPSGPWTAALAGLDQLATADLDAWTDQDVRDGLLALLPAANRLSAVISVLVDIFNSRTLARSDGLRTTRSWLTGFGQVSQGAATGWLRRGRLMRDLPTVAARARAGTISPEHLRKIDDLTTQIGPEQVRLFEDALAESAAALSPRALAKECERVRAWVDPESSAPRPDASERRGLTISRRGSLFNVRGQLDLEGGALVLTAMDALMRPPAPDDTRTPEQRRADAFVDLARHALTQGTLPTVGGVRPHLGILVTPEMLMLGRPSGGRSNADDASHEGGSPSTGSGRDPLGDLGVPTPPEPPWLQWAGTVPATLAQRIACDSDIWRAVLDPATGLPLEVGRSHRIVPHWIRKALHARDRGCRWPGCGVPAAWTDAHHVVEWYFGGETNIDQMLLLCRWHHMLVHEGQWRVTFDQSTAEVRVTRPDGSPYELEPSQPWRLVGRSSSLSPPATDGSRYRGASQPLDEAPPDGTVA